MDNLRRLGKGFTISIPTDEKGYTGRRCPNENCKGFFKIVFGTGLKGESLPGYCPYCGHEDESSKFIPSEQLEYAKSMAIRRISEAVYKDFKKFEFDIKPKGNFGLGLSLKLQRPRIPAIKYYHEEQLETEIECAGCTLRYSIFGVFAFCPDCASHNSVQILNANLDLTLKQLELAEREGGELARQLIEDALENCVTACDAHGRELCSKFTSRNSQHAAISQLSFQNLEKTRSSLVSSLGVDISASVSADQWSALLLAFQKRHLITHKLGVIDQTYVNRSGDTGAIVGRKVVVSIDEVRQVIDSLRLLGKYLTLALK